MSTRLEVMNEDKKRPKFLNVKELSEMLRLKTRTIYDMVSQGRIPYRKAGDRTIFLLDEILEWTKPHSRDS
jgi:excisionase family DNA binding protein